MHRYALLLCFVVTTNITSAQWAKKLQLPAGELLTHLSAVNDSTAWAVSRSAKFYITTDYGKHWQVNTAAAIPRNQSVLYLYAINASTALLAVNTIFTGVGPGIVYRTTDGGINWQTVYSHEGNCEIQIEMANQQAGLMICSFSSFNGSTPPGQEVLRTLDGGVTWTKNGITNPSDDFNLNELAVINKEAWLTDYHFLYHTANLGRTWEKEALPLDDSWTNYLQVVNNDYLILNFGALIDLYMKRPGTSWIHVTDPSPNSGAVTGLILDDNECLLAMALDLPNMYYSRDSAKNFVSTGSAEPGSFIIMERSRKATTLWGITFPGSAIWVNRRQTVAAEAPLAQTGTFLAQNMPNPAVAATHIKYKIPVDARQAQLVIINRNGLTVKSIPVKPREGIITIPVNHLQTGTYFYSLIVDGKKTETRQMPVIH